MSFVKYIMDLYEYITNTIYCFIIEKILFDSSSDDSYNYSNNDSFDPDHIPSSDIIQHIPFQEDIIMDKYYNNVNDEHCNNRNGEHTEMKDKFDEYTKLITITDRAVYIHDHNYYNDINCNDMVITNKNMSRFKKSVSYNAKHYYCGFCSKIIKLPEFMYKDKTFCTNRCRNSQISADKKNSVREHHSFSI